MKTKNSKLFTLERAEGKNKWVVVGSNFISLEDAQAEGDKWWAHNVCMKNIN